METFQAINDEALASIIRRAVKRVVYVSPGVGQATTEALVDAIKLGRVAVTVIIDADEDACRIGYGDHKALAALHEATRNLQFPLRQQQGIRIGLLVSDDDLVIWAPTARSVEAERKPEQPNAIVLKGPAVDKVEAAVGSDQSSVLASQAEIGRTALRPQHLAQTVQKLNDNPPAPFDLSQKTHVFSTRFQFVEFEVRGAEWTERRIKLSSLVLNADLPEALQDILETRIHPFHSAADTAFAIPLVVNGEKAFRADGSRLVVAAKQADIAKEWVRIRDRYLKPVKGFGWLIQRDRLEKFKAEIEAYEECLKAWVDAFRNHVRADEDNLIDSIVSSISARIERATNRDRQEGLNLKAEVAKGLQRIRVIDPKVRIVLKNVSWESSRDNEFNAALKQAFTQEELQGWFEEFTAAKQHPNS